MNSSYLTFPGNVRVSLGYFKPEANILVRLSTFQFMCKATHTFNELLPLKDVLHQCSCAEVHGDFHIFWHSETTSNCHINKRSESAAKKTAIK